MTKTRLGPFALEEVLGRDRSSSVYHAVHIQKQQVFAVRVFPAVDPLVHRQLGPGLRQDFAQLRALRHPHIVRYYGGGFEANDDARVDGYLVMEYVPGESLEDLLDRRNRLSWETVVEYGDQLASALQYAHEQGFVHGAIHPQKVLVHESGEVKLTDFRSVRPLLTTDRQGQVELRRAAYLAPEQLTSEPARTERADLYALGCLMFHMLAGHSPYHAMSVAALARQKQQEPPQVATEVLDCPVWLDALLRQLLDPDPARRPYSAAAVKLALRETRKVMSERRGVIEHAASGFSPLRTGLDKAEARRILGWRRKSRTEIDRPPLYERIWFLVLCLLVLLAGGWWLLKPPTEQQLLARAEGLLASENPVDWRRAQTEYLEPLLRRYPEGAFADRAQQYLDQIEMDRAERRFRRRVQLGRRPSSEGERLFAEAWQFESFGDRLTALEKYRGMVELLKSDADARPWANLARRQIQALQEDELSADRARFLEQQLAEAERLAEQGRLFDARQVWQSLLALYEGNRELAVYVDRARQALLATDPPAESTGPPEPPPGTVPLGTGPPGTGPQGTGPGPQQGADESLRDAGGRKTAPGWQERHGSRHRLVVARKWASG